MSGLINFMYGTLARLCGGKIESIPKVDLIQIKFCNKTISINVDYADAFVQADAELSAYYPDVVVKIKRIDSYNPRYIAGTNIWSFHAYGQAIDVNPEQFPQTVNSYELPDWFLDLVILMKDYGFRWGGDWTGKFDPMHFEIGKRN